MGEIVKERFAAITALSSGERYEHFIHAAAGRQELWSLRSTEGWALDRDEEGRPLISVWPERCFAEACAVGAWRKTSPAIVPLKRWLEELTPRLVRDGWRVAVFPTPERKGVVVAPEELRDGLLERRSR
jgi:hypothetical protein